MLVTAIFSQGMTGT